MADANRLPDRTGEGDAPFGVDPLPVSAGQPDGPSMIDSAELLRGEREISIHHDGAIYRLRRTSKGKLILTK